MPGASLRLPARTQLFSATLGMSCTGQTMIFNPLASVVARTSSRPGTRGTAGSTAAVSEPTVRKCEPKLLFIACESTGPFANKALPELKSVSSYFRDPFQQLKRRTMGTKGGAAREIAAGL